MIKTTLVLLASSTLLAAPALAEDEKPKSAADKPEMACRTYPVTGSIARVQKVCTPKKSADRSGREVRDETNNMINKIQGGLPKI